MADTPREIKDRVAVGDDIFIVEDLGDNRIRLIPAPTHVLEVGTPVNKALLQPMENHMGDVANPHATTKAQVGLGNVDNVKQATKAEFDAHKADFANPHATTKAQVGLGSVQNYGIATKAQAEAGRVNNVYMTPLRVKEAISSLTPVTSVAGKTGAVTLSKSDVGLGSVQNYGIATKAQAEAGTVNNVYMTPLRVAEAIASLGSEVKIATGVYTGDELDLEAVVNVGFAPKFVISSDVGFNSECIAIRLPDGAVEIRREVPSSTGQVAIRGTTANRLTSTGFKQSAVTGSSNKSNKVYAYVAIG